MKKNEKIIGVKYYLSIPNKPSDKSTLEISRKTWLVLIESCLIDGVRFSIQFTTWNTSLLRRDGEPHETTFYIISIKE